MYTGFTCCRHFVKDELPRVAYNNPSLAIDVQRKEKAKEENWDPELVIELGDHSFLHSVRLRDL